MDFTEKIKALREKEGNSQTEIAKFLSISRQGYNHYETGKREPNNETIKKLAEYFGVTSDYLLGLSETPAPELVIPDELKNVQVAFHRGEFEDLTQEEVNALAMIAKTIKSQRKL